jgi:hypothetical protein
MSHQIDLNSLLPEGIRFTPLFEKESDYREFRERYAVEESGKAWLEATGFTDGFPGF